MILLVTCVINLTLGVLILLHDPKARFVRFFAIMSLVICIWIVSNFITNLSTPNLAINDLANKIAYISGYGLVLSGLIFTYLFPVRRPIGVREAIAIVVMSCLVLGLSYTSLVAGNVSLSSTSELEFSVGPLIWVYLLGFITLLALIVRNMLTLPEDGGKSRRTQARLVLIAFCTSALLGLILNVGVPLLTNNWYFTRFGPLATILLVVIIAYAIVWHGLFDIRRAVVRTVAYVLALSTLAAIYYILIYTISSILFSGQSSLIEQSPYTIALALILAFFFQPTKRLFDRITNAVFYKDGYNTGDFFARLNHIMTSTTDLYSLLTHSATEIATTLKAEQAFFVIHRSATQSLIVGMEHHSRIPQADVEQLSIYAQSHHNAVIISNLLESIESDSVMHRLMISHKIALVLPLELSHKQVGFLCLGEQMSSGFTKHDLNVLETMSDELTIAIQNALVVQEMRDLNASLQQRINSATKELRATNAQLHRLDEAKDEFISMASHQLRTPLTSVKGYISMVLEGDAGRVSSMQKHLLGEAFTSSERMVHLINDFLNVSRLQTGKFIIDKRPIDLAKVVQEELDSLETSASSRGLSFSYKAPKNFPVMELDEGKIRQVVMNFADNAIYYSREGSKIKVELSVDKADAVFIVKDAGIGVPLAEQPHLFTKFYRASNARKQRPDGTGVGLFLAKKVIVAHRGEVIFASSEGKGSTFGFRLPLDQTIPQ